MPAESSQFTSARAIEMAKAALDDAITAGIGVTVKLEIENPRDGEPSLVFEPRRGSGILHEDVLRVVELAAKHEGRLWIQHAAEWNGLAILWPVYQPAGPGGVEAESPAQKTRRAAKRNPSISSAVPA